MYWMEKYKQLSINNEGLPKINDMELFHGSHVINYALVMLR